MGKSKVADGASPETLALEAQSAFMVKARTELGHQWGLARPLTHAELGRALKLSPKFGGSHVSKLESKRTTLTGPIEVAIVMMLNGAVPPTADDIVKPGYPRAVKAK